MSKSLIVAAGIFAVTMTAAAAADMRMPVKAPPIVDPPISWSGFYLGGDLGGSWGRGQTDQSDISTTATTATTTTTTSTLTRLFRGTSEIVGTSLFTQVPGTFPNTTTTGPVTTTAAGATTAVATSTRGKANVNGFMGGGQIGFRQQFSTWVLGLEGDIEGSTERGRFTECSIAGCPIGSTIGTADFRLRWLSTLRGTVGYLVHPKILLYGTGGLAIGQVDVDYTSGINGGSLTAGGVRTTRAGFAVGGGVEGKIDQHWSVRGQYLFVDLGSFSTNLGGGAAIANTATATSSTTGAPVTTTIFSDINTQATTTTNTSTTTTTTTSTAAQVRIRLRDHIFKIAFNYQF